MELETPTEDLMFEHGLLNRILLVYENLVKRLSNNETSKQILDIVYNSAYIIRIFIEDYHEKNEEKYIFPIVLKNCKTLVNELLSQHRLGRKLTTRIMKNSSNYTNIDIIISDILKFIYMYRAHESREDTVIFKKFNELYPGQKISSLSEKFERSEEDKFGEDGYKKILGQIISMEKQLGIYNLNTYSPEI